MDLTIMIDTDLKGRNLRAMLAENNANFRTIMRGILTSIGIRSIIDTDGAIGALEIANSSEFDLAFIDLKLPDFSGLEIASIIRSSIDNPNRQRPLILMTSDSRVSVIRAAINAGFESVLVKPTRPVDVRRQVEHLLDHPIPYISTTNYFGPCRRRRDDPQYRGPKRRYSDIEEDAFDLDCLDLGQLSVNTTA